MDKNVTKGVVTALVVAGGLAFGQKAMAHGKQDRVNPINPIEYDLYNADSSVKVIYENDARMKSGETEAELRENKRSVKGMFRSALDGNLRMSVDLPELLKGNIVVGGLTNFPLRPDDDEIVSDDVVSKYIGLDGVCSGAELVAASHTIQSDYVAWYYGRMNATERAQYVINECNSKLKVLTRRIAELRQEYESTQDPQKQFNLLANIRELEGVNGIIYFENTRSAAEQQLTTETATEPSREL